MLDGIPPGLLDLTGPGALAIIAVLVITRRLVWHTDLAEVKAQRDRWESIALTALSAAERLTVHAEVTEKVLSSIPTPDQSDTTAGGESP